MTQFLSSARPKRRVPRLSIPGGLMLALCFFLPAVKGCDKPIYPYELPLVCGPYLFGLLVAGFALAAAERRARLAGFVAYIVGVAGAASEGYFLLRELVSKFRNEFLYLTPAILAWAGLATALVLSVRHRQDLERWRAQLLWSGGGLCLLFFMFWTLYDKIYYGMWLSVASSLLLVAEGLLATRQQSWGLTT